jgi:hypothetical protein
MRHVWRKDVKILIIDEISFFKTGDMERLNRQLQNLTGRRKIFGGISIIFSGDFHQRKPICSERGVLYSGSTSATAWEQALNCAIFLNNSHRFKDDPQYGMILERMRMGEDTVADREEINKLVIDPQNGIKPVILSRVRWRLRKVYCSCVRRGFFWPCVAARYKELTH